MERIIVTPQGSATSSRQKARKSLSSPRRNSKKSREVNLLEKQASRQRAKYLKHKKLNKAFSKKMTRVILEDSERDSSSSSEEENSSDEGEKNSIT